MSIEFLSEEYKAKLAAYCGKRSGHDALDIEALLHEIRVVRRALENAQDQGFSRMSDEMHIAHAKREIEGGG